MSYYDDLYEAAEREMDLIREQAEHKSAGLVEENDRLRRERDEALDHKRDWMNATAILRRERDEWRKRFQETQHAIRIASDHRQMVEEELKAAEAERDEWKAIVAGMPCESPKKIHPLSPIAEDATEEDTWCGECGPCRARKETKTNEGDK